jgi:hypothetical protein
VGSKESRAFFYYQLSLGLMVRPDEIRFALTKVTRLNVLQIQQVKNFMG